MLAGPSLGGPVSSVLEGHRRGGGVPRLGGVGVPMPSSLLLTFQRDLDLSPGQWQGHGHVAP